MINMWILFSFVHTHTLKIAKTHSVKLETKITPGKKHRNHNNEKKLTSWVGEKLASCLILSIWFLSHLSQSLLAAVLCWDDFSVQAIVWFKSSYRINSICEVIEVSKSEYYLQAYTVPCITCSRLMLQGHTLRLWQCPKFNNWHETLTSSTKSLNIQLWNKLLVDLFEPQITPDGCSILDSKDMSCTEHNNDVCRDIYH